MSILIMSQVWAHSNSTGSARLILLAIADFADDKGTAYPSVETLATKARVSERTVQYCLRELVESGELVILEGEGRRGCNLYRVQNLQGCKIEREGVQSTTKRGAMGCTRTVIEPSEEPSLFAAKAAEENLVKTPKCRKRREPDVVFDTIAEVCGMAGKVNDMNAGKIAMVKKNIIQVTPDVTALEIQRRAKNYRIIFPGMTLTPTALAMHWVLCQKSTGGSETPRVAH